MPLPWMTFAGKYDAYVMSIGMSLMDEACTHIHGVLEHCLDAQIALLSFE